MTVAEDIASRIARMSPERQRELLDFAEFLLDREEEERCCLTEAELRAAERHLRGDLSDTVALAQVADALRRGATDEL